MESQLGVKFWGTRGLVSAPAKDHLKYGGNSPSIQIIHGNHLILVDTGFGVSNLGEVLMEKIIRDKLELKIDIFFTHFHWDHIQGLPFFHPIYFKSSILNLYSPESPEVMFKNLNQLFDGSYSPFDGIHNMPSKVNLISLQQTIVTPDLKVGFCPTDHGVQDQDANHPHTFAYRFDFIKENKSICVVTDHEAGETATNRKLIEFCQNTDLLIHDGQYFDHDYESHRGWGHSLVGTALENGRLMKAKRIILTHHDPSRSDKEIDSSYTLLKGQPENRDLQFVFAQEEIFYPVG